MRTLEHAGQAHVFMMPLAAIRLQDLPRVGGKAAHLGELLAAGLPVPPGFVVTTDACRRFMQSDPRIGDWLNSLEKCDDRNPIALRASLDQVIQRLSCMPVPPDVVHAIAAAMAPEPGSARAVRSSATVEDSPEMSFAGQHDSFLNVRGCDAVVDAVKRCWLSLFSERAISYRMRKGVPRAQAQMAVIVQRLIDADTAGAMFTADPAGSGSNTILIEAAFGLGEAVVQGKVTPDRFQVSRSGLAVVRRDTASKRLRIVASRDGVCEEMLTAERAIAPVLADDTVVRLARLGLKVERLLGAPQDIEWAQRDSELFLLQSRPITSKAPVKTWEDRQLWSNFNTGEIAPDVMVPVTWSMIQSLTGGALFRSLFRMLGADARCAPLVGLVAGRLYFNANTSMAALKPFSFLLKNSTTAFQAVGGGQAEAYRQVLAIPPDDLPDLGFRWPKYILSWPRIAFDLITHLPGRGEAWLARFRTWTDELVRMDIEALSTPELIGHCVRLIREPFKGWDLLYWVTQGVVLPLFQKAFRDWLGNPDASLGHRLFSGLGGMPTAEAGLALWRLAALARADRNTEAVVRSECDWPLICARLQLTEHGRKFLAAWDAFMAEHGHHCRGEFELFNARWSETPDYVLAVVRSYLRSDEQLDPLEKQRQLSGERERLTEQFRRQLKNPVKRWAFLWSLRGVQKLLVFREQMKNEGVRQIAMARRLLLALGRRLHEQGTLSCSNDIFFLEVSEIESLATGNAPANCRQRIATRRQQYEKDVQLSPPSLVVGKFDPNALAWPVPDADAKRLEGIAASPGMVTGPARVILRAGDQEQVLPGEILIAPFTDPAWSPYFVNAAGLVVEQGGILSHGSIVAREYGLPAVTNVGSATRVIHTGDLVQVDGNCGRVNILARGRSGTSECTSGSRSAK